MAITASSDQRDCRKAVEVDFIILSLNRAEDTILAIESALLQRGIEANVIVVDQGSRADCVQSLHDTFGDHPRVTIKALGRNIGVAGGRNIASRLGTAPFIIALDNDAEFAALDTAANAVTLMQADPNLAACGFRVLNFFTGEDDWTSWCYPASFRRLSASTFSTTQFCGCGHIIRRSFFERVGAYDDALFFIGEEKDLCYRMINAGGRVQYAGGIAVRHKVHPEQRVAWTGGRYYYSVRNTLYLRYKYRFGAVNILLSAMGWTAKGAYNGLLGSALRGVKDAVLMAVRFERHADKRHYRLSKSAKAHIMGIEGTNAKVSFPTKVSRQFVKLSRY